MLLKKLIEVPSKMNTNNEAGIIGPVTRYVCSFRFVAKPDVTHFSTPTFQYHYQREDSLWHKPGCKDSGLCLQYTDDSPMSADCP